MFFFILTLLLKGNCSGHHYSAGVWVEDIEDIKYLTILFYHSWSLNNRNQYILFLELKLSKFISSSEPKVKCFKILHLAMPSAVNLNVIKIIFKSPEIFYGLCRDETDGSEGLTNISITEIKPDYFNYFRFGTGAW